MCVKLLLKNITFIITYYSTNVISISFVVSFMKNIGIITMC